MGNESLDVTVQGCFRKDKNAVACFREAFETTFALITGLVCIYKVARLHYAKHELINQYIIFYSAFAECVLCGVNWLYFHEPVCDFIAEFLKLLQFLVVCRFYCQVAARVAKKEHLYQKVFLPALGVTLMYFVVLIVIGIVDVRANFYECLESEWLQLSVSEVLLGMVFVYAGYYITRKINSLRTDSDNKKSIRRDLWSIIGSFLVSSSFSMAYDITMLVVGEENQCKGVFIYDVKAYSAFHIVEKVMKWLLPIWAMALIFKPESFRTEEEDKQPPLVRSSSAGPFFSEFRPRGSSFHYKYLFDPDNDNERRLLIPPLDGSQTKKKKKRRRKKLDSSRSDTGDEQESAGSASGPGSAENGPAVIPVDTQDHVRINGAAPTMV